MTAPFMLLSFVEGQHAPIAPEREALVSRWPVKPRFRMRPAFVRYSPSVPSDKVGATRAASPSSSVASGTSFATLIWIFMGQDDARRSPRALDVSPVRRAV